MRLTHFFQIMPLFSLILCLTLRKVLNTDVLKIYLKQFCVSPILDIMTKTSLTTWMPFLFAIGGTHATKSPHDAQVWQNDNFIGGY